jgi:crotonobetainyl-CoA:carnitine CoA-transferase CaiB-like acyl-CoA transferase
MAGTQPTSCFPAIQTRDGGSDDIKGGETVSRKEDVVAAVAGDDEYAPLQGLKVLDFTQILAGPFCTQLLADAGATVIKVEPPGGEWSGTRGSIRTVADGAVSSYRAAANRGKRSIALDLKNPRGLDLGRRLALGADVVVENFAPGALDRLGLRLSELRAQRPRLITCSISLFGRGDAVAEADLATRRALAVVAEAESSLLGMLRQGKDAVPAGFGFSLGDIVTGLAAYAAVVTALADRDRSAAGRHIDIAMARALLPLNSAAVIDAQFSPSADPQRTPAGYGAFATKDGTVAFGINTDVLFGRLARMMDAEWMLADPRYSSYAERDSRKAEVEQVIAGWCATQATQDIVDRALASEVPCGRVATPADMAGDEVYRRIGLIQQIADGVGGQVMVPANPFGIQGRATGVPTVGQHTAEILEQELGIGDADRAELSARGAFGPDG